MDEPSTQAKTVSGWMPDTSVHRKGSGHGPLEDLSFAVKDLFEIRGHAASFGHPKWQRTHEPAERDAPVLRTLLGAGAELRGVTVMDELAYSLSGENPNYGTPRNPAAPGRVCGGSSCGSASVVAEGSVDFALGTDTAGSIRLPASFCGLYGFRPSHGRVSIEGALPLAKSFDTVGWLARDAKTLAMVGEVLLGEAAGGCRKPQHVLVAEDAFKVLDNAPRTHLFAAVRQACRTLLLDEEPIHLATEGLPRWYAAFRRMQAREVWRTHGAWVDRYRPRFGPGVRERFIAAEGLSQTNECEKDDAALRESIAQRMRTLLPEGTLLVIPSAPCPAPPIGTDADAWRELRIRATQLTCISGLAGLPQISVPLGNIGGLPLGLSMLAAHGQDAALLELACRITCRAPGR